MFIPWETTGTESEPKVIPQGMLDTGQIKTRDSPPHMAKPFSSFKKKLEFHLSEATPNLLPPGYVIYDLYYQPTIHTIVNNSPSREGLCIISVVVSGHLALCLGYLRNVH